MGTCPTNTDGSLTPFVAKYCTAFGYDMDMMRTMSGQELICAMSEKLNEAVCFDNETREMQEQVQTEWEGLDERFDTNLAAEVDKKITELVDDGTISYIASQGNLVVFGDSWSDGSVNPQYLWCNAAARELDCKLFNYAVAGASFTDYSGYVKTLAQEISDAESAMTADEKLRVEHVFILMGVNDATNNAETVALQSAFNAAITSIRSMFPHAEVRFSCDVPHVTSAYNFGYKYIGVLKALQEACLWSNVQYVSMAPMAWRQNCYETDLLHPSQYGMAYITMKMLGCGAFGCVIQQDIDIPDHAGDKIHMVSFGDEVYLQFQIASNTTGYTANVPQALWFPSIVATAATNGYVLTSTAEGSNDMCTTFTVVKTTGTDPLYAQFSFDASI